MFQLLDFHSFNSNPQPFHPNTHFSCETPMPLFLTPFPFPKKPFLWKNPIFMVLIGFWDMFQKLDFYRFNYIPQPFYPNTQCSCETPMPLFLTPIPFPKNTHFLEKILFLWL